MTFLFLPSLLFCQEEAEESHIFYIISERHYIIDGLSHTSALEKELDLPEEPVFSSYEEMVLFSRNLEQDLKNLRLFSRVGTYLAELPSRVEGAKEYRLIISLQDAWTFIPLAYAKFDTNTGFTMESKILYSNFLGTLMDFKMDGYLEVSPPDDMEIEGLDTGQWEVITSLGNIHWRDRIYRFEWLQDFDRVQKTNIETTVEDYTFHETQLLLETAFPVTSELSYILAPIFNMKYSYKNRMVDTDGTMPEEPFALGVQQNLVWENVNWHGNFRQGSYYDLGALLRYSFITESGFKGLGSLESGWFRIFSDFSGLSLRTVALSSFNDEQSDLGSYMRGVPDHNLYGKTAFFLNSSAPLKIFSRKEFVELQFEPFMDGGLTFREDQDFSTGQDIRLSTGFSFLFFFHRLTSIQVRTTFGWNLLSPASEENSFEFLLSTSLFY